MCDLSSPINVLARMSEDCLNLNVIIPKNTMPGDNIKVYAYVYGGKFTDGYDSFPYAWGSRNIIKSGHNVIVITMNYSKFVV
jgi:carboxylesterase type B